MISPAQFAEMRARLSVPQPALPGTPKPARPVRENALHGLIMAECHRRALIAFHGRTDKRSGRTPGEPDFVILLPLNRTLLIECKRAQGGRLSPDQENLRIRAALLGHRIHVVTNFQQFHSLLKTELHAGAFAGAAVGNKPKYEDQT